MNNRMHQEWINKFNTNNNRKRNAQIYKETEEIKHPPFQSDPSNVITAYIDLSSELKEVVDTMWNAPNEFIRELRKGGGLEFCIIEYFKNVRSWGKERLDKLQTELKSLR